MAVFILRLICYPPPVHVANFAKFHQANKANFSRRCCRCRGNALSDGLIAGNDKNSSRWRRRLASFPFTLTQLHLRSHDHASVASPDEPGDQPRLFSLCLVQRAAVIERLVAGVGATAFFPPVSHRRQIKDGGCRCLSGGPTSVTSEQTYNLTQTMADRLLYPPATLSNLAAAAVSRRAYPTSETSVG